MGVFPPGPLGIGDSDQPRQRIMGVFPTPAIRQHRRSQMTQIIMERRGDPAQRISDRGDLTRDIIMGDLGTRPQRVDGGGQPSGRGLLESPPASVRIHPRCQPVPDPLKAGDMPIRGDRRDDLACFVAFQPTRVPGPISHLDHITVTVITDVELHLRRIHHPNQLAPLPHQPGHPTHPINDL